MLNWVEWRVVYLTTLNSIWAITNFGPNARASTLLKRLSASHIEPEISAFLIQIFFGYNEKYALAIAQKRISRFVCFLLRGFKCQGMLSVLILQRDSKGVSWGLLLGCRCGSVNKEKIELDAELTAFRLNGIPLKIRGCNRGFLRKTAATRSWHHNLLLCVESLVIG